MKHFCLIIATALAFGCAHRINTRSGRPEVTVRGVSLERVQLAFEHNLADRGFALMRTEGASVIGEKDASAASQMLLGTPGRTARARIQLNFIEGGGEVRVLYHGFVGQEEVYGDWKKQQAELERVAAGLEAKR